MSPKFDVPPTGPGPISFRQLMALRQLDVNTFESRTPAWPPASRLGVRAFGGHVYAQTVCAASKTVPQGAVVHDVTGHFILPGDIKTPFIYKVRRIRDGGIYFLRSVDVYQDSTPDTPCFVATLSFKREESMQKWIEYGHHNAKRDHINQEYASVLDGTKITDHPLAPGADAMWWNELAKEEWIKAANNFPGLEMRKVDMFKYNGTAEQGGGLHGEGASKWRQLLFYRIILDDEDTGPVDYNLHAAAHCYASDRNSLFLIPRAFGYEKKTCTLASLSHTVVFHGPAKNMSLTSESGTPIWFVQEAWTSNTGGNRGCHESRMWDYENDKVAATSVQDGMIRIPKNNWEAITIEQAKAREKL